MSSLRRRRFVAACAAAVALAPLIVLRLQGTAAPVHIVEARDATHTPWFDLRLVHDDVAFRIGRGARATPPATHAAAGILIDPDTGRILWEFNADAELPPASTMKLLTALVVLANFSPDDVVTATSDALTQRGDESRMGLRAGNALTVTELLTALLTVSANDAATVLAVDTVGMERFVGAMNAEVTALGLQETHATSPVGLDDPQMYSSAHDLAAIASVDVDRYALFRSIVATQTAVIPAGDTHDAFYLRNLNLLLRMYPAADGIKTGWTGRAGSCEVGMAVRDGHRLISVLLNGSYVYSATRSLLDWGFVQEGLPSLLRPAA